MSRFVNGIPRFQLYRTLSNAGLHGKKFGRSVVAHLVASFKTRSGTPHSDHDVLLDVLYPDLRPPQDSAWWYACISSWQGKSYAKNHVPPDFTKGQLGHSSLRTTSDYTHFPDSFKREVVERLALRELT